MAPKKRVGLALGSGASRGWAHIGVIEALEEEGISIHCIAGSSIGAYVGALYAAGCLKSLKAFVLSMDGKKIYSYFDVVFPRSGLLDGTRRLKALFSMHTAVETFSDLKIPVAMVAADLETGAKVILDSGNLLEALRATLSIPGLFAPAKVNNRWLVDGGVIDPVPVGACRSLGADRVIAVDLTGSRASRVKAQPLGGSRVADRHGIRSELVKKMVGYYEGAGSGFKARLNDLLKRETETPDIVETVTASINIMQRRITRVNLAVDPPDVLVQPQLGEMKMLEFDRVEQAIEEGRRAVKEQMDDIRTRITSP